jgi:hypothetical protein
VGVFALAHAGSSTYCNCQEYGFLNNSQCCQYLPIPHLCFVPVLGDGEGKGAESAGWRQIRDRIFRYPGLSFKKMLWQLSIEK